MKLRLFVVIFLLFLSINVASASLDYWIEGVSSGDRVFVEIPELSAGETKTLMLTKESGYSPDISNVMLVNYMSSLSDGQSIACTYNTGVWEYDLSLGDQTLNSRSRLNIVYIDSTNNMGWYYRPDTNANYLEKYIGGSSTTYGLTTTDLSTGTHHVIIERDDSGLTSVSVDDVSLGSATISDAIFDSTAYINSWIPGTAGISNVFVRQYISDEPTVIIEDQGSYYTITVTENSDTTLTDYQIYFDATDISLTSTTESLNIIEANDPYIILKLESPLNDSIINSSTVSFNVSGYGDLYASLIMDNIYIWNDSISSGVNTTDNLDISDGLHSWYVNGSATYEGNTTYNVSETWYFTYDSINPSIATTDIDPDYSNIANGTTVQTNIEWSDINLENASFYVDYGSGYSLEDSTTFSSTTEWFNTSINTTGYTGELISWYQIAYDEAGNSYTYSDSFSVVESALNIYVYDETTSEQILPSNVVIYNEDISKEATISESTKIASLDYNGLSSDRYIVRVSADDYYSRNSILYVDVESLAELNVYLPSENETVIFDQFALTDNTGSYDEGECIVRLDKPLTDGTDTVFSSYFDFDGVASTYLIATDQYILYVETPDRTISYGWLSPDSDGVIDIVISNTPVGEIEEWLNYSLTHDDYGVISLSYESNLEIDNVNFWVNATNGTNLYTASSSSDIGSFTYTGSNNSTYYASFSALSESGKTIDITRVITFTGSGVQDDLLNFLPEDAPDWLYNLVGGSIVVISVLMFGQFRMDVGCVIGAALTGLFWYWGLLQITGIVVAVGVIIAVAAVLSRSRRS